MRPRMSKAAPHRLTGSGLKAFGEPLHPFAHRSLVSEAGLRTIAAHGHSRLKPDGAPCVYQGCVCRKGSGRHAPTVELSDRATGSRA